MNQGPTFANVASQGAKANQTSGPKKTLKKNFLHPPPPLEGQYPDNLIIKIRQVNGVTFKGSLQYK